MSLSLVERPSVGTGSGGVWFLSGHNTDVLRVATDDSDVFASCDVGGVGLLWKCSTSSPDAEPIHVSRIMTDGPAIVDACFLHHTRLCTAQGDATVGVWDVETAQRVQSLRRAASRGRWCDWPVVNAVTTSSSGSIAYGGDDGFFVLSDPAQKETAASINLRVPITSISASSDSFFLGDVLGNIRCLDARMLRCVYSFKAHSDVVSCLALSTGANTMVSYGMDNILAHWDVLPFALSNMDRLLHRGNMWQGDSRKLLRCGWSTKDTILVPRGDGHIVCVRASGLEGGAVTLPVYHRAGPALCAAFVNDNLAVSSAESELILQPLS